MAHGLLGQGAVRLLATCARLLEPFRGWRFFLGTYHRFRQRAAVDMLLKEAVRI